MSGVNIVEECRVEPLVDGDVAEEETFEFKVTKQELDFLSVVLNNIDLSRLGNEPNPPFNMPWLHYNLLMKMGIVFREPRVPYALSRKARIVWIDVQGRERDSGDEAPLFGTEEPVAVGKDATIAVDASPSPSVNYTWVSDNTIYNGTTYATTADFVMDTWEQARNAASTTPIMDEPVAPSEPPPPTERGDRVRIRTRPMPRLDINPGRPIRVAPVPSVFSALMTEAADTVRAEVDDSLLRSYANYAQQGEG